MEAQHVYDETEHLAVQHGQALFAVFGRHDGKAKQMPLVATLDKAEIKYDQVTSTFVAKAELVIRGGSLQEISAYLMEYDSRHMQARLGDVDIRDELREIVNPHHLVIFYECKPPPPFRHRTFLNVYVWQKLSETQHRERCAYRAAQVGGHRR